MTHLQLCSALKTVCSSSLSSPLSLQALHCPPFLCSYFPGILEWASCRLNCFLLLHLCTCQMRSDSDEVHVRWGSADSNQIKISVMWDMIRSIFTLLSPNGLLSSDQGRETGEPMNQNCFPGWVFSLGSPSRLVSTNTLMLRRNMGLTWNFLQALLSNCINL